VSTYGHAALQFAMTTYRLEDVESRLADTEKETDKARKDTKKARDDFNDIRKRR
jgi:hypothetical protein